MTLGDRFIHDRDVDWLRQSDGEVLIAASWLLWSFVFFFNKGSSQG